MQNYKIIYSRINPTINFIMNKLINKLHHEYGMIINVLILLDILSGNTKY